MTTRQALYGLINQLPESAWPEAERLLETLLDGQAKLPPTLANVPWDDEPETEEEHALVQEAYEAIARSEVVNDEDLERELGW